MYIKICMSNGYSGCDDYEYAEVDNVEDANDYLVDALANYSFAEPDERFCDIDDEEEVSNYYDMINDYSYWEEISKEEFEENT